MHKWAGMMQIDSSFIIEKVAKVLFYNIFAIFFCFLLFLS